MFSKLFKSKKEGKKVKFETLDAKNLSNVIGGASVDKITSNTSETIESSDYSMGIVQNLRA